MRVYGYSKAFTLVELLVVVVIIGLLMALAFPLTQRALDSAHSSGCLSNLKQIGMGCQLYSADHDDKLVPMAAGETFTSSTTWRAMVNPYIGDDKSYKVFRCPGDIAMEQDLVIGSSNQLLAWRPASYGLNNYGGMHNSVNSFPNRKMTSIPSPVSTIMVFDIGRPGNPGQDASTWVDVRGPASASFGWATMTPNSDWCVFPRHGQKKKVGVLFYDGHAGLVDYQKDLIDNPPGSPGCIYDYN